MRKSDLPIVVEQNFNVSITELWSAVTELKQMKQWFFENIEAFEPKIGFESRFVVENEGRRFPHLLRITEAEALKKIKLDWSYEGYAGNSFVTIQFFEKEKGTSLKLIHTITEDFPPNIPEFTRESCQSGWNYFIKESLTDYMKLKK